MLSIQQLLKALRKLQNNTVAGGDLVKSIKHVAVCANNSKNETNTTTIIPIGTTLVTSLKSNHNNNNDDKEELLMETSSMTFGELSEQPQQTTEKKSSGGGGGGSSNKASRSTTYSNQIYSSQLLLKQQTTQQHNNCHASQNECFSLYSPVNADSSDIHATTTQDSVLNKAAVITTNTTTSPLTYLQQPQRSQRIQNFYQQQIFHQFHTQHNQNLNTKQKQTTFAMSSLAAEPLTLQKSDVHSNGKDLQDKHDDESSSTPSSSSASSSSASCPDTKQQNSSTGKPCFNTGLADILQFMELIGNLKHTKRTGWVLRDVNDCESISGHMYRMSMLTFLLDGSEGLNQIKCMELALVHDLAESLVGDITPFCGITKEEKKNMELKAMEDICKLIEPRGKRIMELFEEYEHGESAESKFVKDLDRLDMVMQAFEYEKRDDCLLKHQEFFDSTEGKFNHPFVKKLVNEIYEQRDRLAKAKGAVPPPKIEVPNMDEPIEKTTNNKTNGHSDALEKTNETSKSS